MAKTLDDILSGLGNPSEDFKKWTNEERLQLFQIDSLREEEIRAFHYEHSNIHVDDCEQPYFAIIELKNLIGSSRNEPVMDWLDQLFFLNKRVNFGHYEKNKDFEQYLLSLNVSSDHLPHVFMNHNGNYFIGNEGKHRLTFAKCLGIERCPVAVSAIKRSKDS